VVTLFSVSYSGFLLFTWDELCDIRPIDKDLLNLPFCIGNFDFVKSSYIIVTRNLPFTIAMSQWILPSTGSLPIEEITNQNKSPQIKSNFGFGERGKLEYTGKKPLGGEYSTDKPNPFMGSRQESNTEHLDGRRVLSALR